MFDEERIQLAQLHMDKFCNAYASFFGGHKITNYLHIMWGGHLRTFLREYGNLYIWANHGFEGDTIYVTIYSINAHVLNIRLFQK